MTRFGELIKQAVDQRFDRMVKMRRHLHQHPEVSGREFETSLMLYQDLGNNGFEVRLGPEGRGVIADFGSPNGASRMFAIRADIDALRIQDEKVEPYRSVHEGVMHACGHDGHTAVVAGAISAIADLHRAGELPFEPRLRGVFQPAEETCEGAADMIAAGALDGVDVILATHMDPTRRVGRIGVRKGVFTANCDHMHISIKGRGGHAARPHEARDPISAAAQLIQWLYTQIPRVTDSQDAVVVTIGKIDGGHTANVIPDQVDLQGTLRTLDSRVREGTIEHIERLARGVAEASQTKIDVWYGKAANAVVNDGPLVELIRNASLELLGGESVEKIIRPSMGSEDFALYGTHVPAAMFRLGCVSDGKGGSGLHTPTFDIDEEALRFGAYVMAHTALHWMQAAAEQSRANEPVA